MNTFTRTVFVLGTILTLLAAPVGVRAAEPTGTVDSGSEDTSGDGVLAGTEDTSGDGLTAPKPPEFSAELISCLKSTMGEAAYQEITSGDREATDDEFDKGDTCFEQFGPKIDPANQPNAANLTFSSETEACLKKNLGENYKSEFGATKSKEEAKAFRTKTKDCFGKGVVGKGAPGELPTEVKSCIVAAVGQAAADSMFSGGKPPAPGSDTFKKIESAKCFKNFGPPQDGDRPPMSAEAQACVEKIMGHGVDDARTEPTEAQKQQIGKECFKGQGNPGGAPAMPEAVQSCLSDAFGGSLEDLKKGPEFMTEDQKTKANDCFKKNNFNPGGQGPQGGGPTGGGPQMSDEARKCVEGIMGKLDGPKEPTEEQKQQMGKECFGGQGGPGGPNGGPQGGSNGGQAFGAGLPPEKQECVAKIMGGSTTPPTDEQKQRIGQECFGGGPNGGPNGGAPGSGNPQGQPSGNQQNQQGPPPGVDDGGKNRPPQDGFQPPANQPQGNNTQGQSTPPTGNTQPPIGANETSPLKACFDRITGGQPPTDAQREQINRECQTQ